MKEPVVVTGIGLVTPLNTFEPVDNFWRSLCSGIDAVSWLPSPMLDTGRKWLMAGIDAGPGVAPEDKFFYIADYAIRTAMQDARIGGELAGLSIGTVLGNILSKQKRLMHDRKGTAHSINTESLSYPAKRLAERHNLDGPRLSISTACASGTDAIGIAARKISGGKAEVMVAGGADVLSDFALTGFHALRALTETKVRPFDRNRSGLALGEGAAFLVLESEHHATERGAKIYGRILGYSSRLDAHHLTAPHREGRGLTDAVRQALVEASLGSEGIGYINAHGTGTVYNDLMETTVIKKVFGEAAYRIPISSTKSMLGHSFGAAGAIETICCLLAIWDKKVPPTINYEEMDPQCDLDYIPNEARSLDLRYAMSLSAGFGGQNSAIIVGGAE